MSVPADGLAGEALRALDARSPRWLVEAACAGSSFHDNGGSLPCLRLTRVRRGHDCSPQGIICLVADGRARHTRDRRLSGTASNASRRRPEDVTDALRFRAVGRGPDDECNHHASPEPEQTPREYPEVRVPRSYLSDGPSTTTRAPVTTRVTRLDRHRSDGDRPIHYARPRAVSRRTCFVADGPRGPSAR